MRENMDQNNSKYGHFYTVFFTIVEGGLWHEKSELSSTIDLPPTNQIEQNNSFAFENTFQLLESVLLIKVH